ncbi:MAG: M20/M25/M40 family metallo-hydrolase [Solobacterium sp.]|nr:M20/M25/M40 family metallo-hydrolase [Solobacterium sp.]
MKFDKDLFIRHLQGMVQIPTVSSSDPEKTRVEEFKKLHAYLEEAYPLVHRTLKREVIGKCALLYTWKGTGKSEQLPLLMTAHQDVVPEGDHSMWKYPPFSGYLDEDGILHGRGTTDSKCNIQAYLDALELLIADGFVPDYDLYLAFGYNEEIMGGPGAAGQILHDELKSRGIELGMAIDECGGVSRREDGSYIATIFVSEKGYADHEFYVDDKGGHSAYPPVHNALGKLGKAIYDLECSRMEPHLCEPVIRQMKASAPFIEGDFKPFYEDPEGNEETLKKLAETEKSINQMMRTTTTPTMAKGSDQANILPEHASVITNSRILPGETLEQLEQHFREVMPEEVQFRLIKGHNPPAVSSSDSYGYHLLQEIMEEKYPGITFIPSMMAGGTDSRYYCDLSPTRSVYRFTGIFESGRSGGAHSVNEHIDTEILCDNVEFYVNLFSRYGK